MVKFEEYLTESLEAKDRITLKREIMRSVGTIWNPSNKFFKNFRTALSNLKDEELQAIWAFSKHIRTGGGLNSPK